MKAELREQLGKAIFDANAKYTDTQSWDASGKSITRTWDNLIPFEREDYRIYGEAAVSSFVGTIMPTADMFLAAIIPVLTDEQKKQLEAAIDAIKPIIEE